MMNHHYRKRTRPMSRTQRACWLFLAMMKTSSGFSPTQPQQQAACSQRILSYSPTPLHLVTDEHHDGDGTTKTKKGPFFRRAVRKILRKKRTEEHETMHMLTEEASETELADDFVKGLRLGDHVNTDFILQNFQNTHPSDVFPATKQHRNVLTNEEEAEVDASIADPTIITKAPRKLKKDQVTKPTKMKSPKKNAARMPTPPTSKYEGGTLVHRMTRSWFKNLLTGIIHRRSKVPPVGLSVKVAPRAVVKKLCRGQFRCDASIDFHRVVFRNIRLTGGSLEAKSMTLGMHGPRYASRFDIHFNNCTLTEDDLFESSCIRNGLARLLVRILNNAGVQTNKIQITAVDIVVRTSYFCVSVSLLLFHNHKYANTLLFSFSFTTAFWQDFVLWSGGYCFWQQGIV